ncbi:DUF1963 domain-containing protein [Aquisphaera insulae]|uniref:DUF1963 domain-containing protein n=1 Tax=Aquisphaera insulae TaxID=2712864 RepID=UPI0013EA0356|nr:DUF1963 domain-containing protein [Aquisphaera insulae]
MTIARRITFGTANATRPAGLTKFGGQPDWREEPRWPLSRTTGKPMRFIAQIALEPPAFRGTGGAMAYLFMTDEEDGEYVDGTWEPDGGENAVVIQPGEYEGAVTPLRSGPTLYRMVEVPGEPRLHPESVEFPVELTAVEEPAFQPQSAQMLWTKEQVGEYEASLQGNKVGGSPLFLQNDEFPEGQGWKLLLQLDSATVPFYVNFGDAGIAYAFVNAEETRGKLLWQCC